MPLEIRTGALLAGFRVDSLLGEGRWAPSTWPRRWPLGPSWSPDGGKIVFVRRSAGQNDVYTVNADGTDPSEVSGILLDEGGPPDWGTHPLTP